MKSSTLNILAAFIHPPAPPPQRQLMLLKFSDQIYTGLKTLWGGLMCFLQAAAPQKLYTRYIHVNNVRGKCLLLTVYSKYLGKLAAIPELEMNKRVFWNQNIQNLVSQTLCVDFYPDLYSDINVLQCCSAWKDSCCISISISILPVAPTIIS